VVVLCLSVVVLSLSVVVLCLSVVVLCLSVVVLSLFVISQQEAWAEPPPGLCPVGPFSNPPVSKSLQQPMCGHSFTMNEYWPRPRRHSFACCIKQGPTSPLSYWLERCFLPALCSSTASQLFISLRADSNICRRPKSLRSAACRDAELFLCISRCVF